MDDTNLVGKPLSLGTRWEEGPLEEGLGKMVTRQERVEEDMDIDKDMEEDYASQHSHKKLPTPNIGGLGKGGSQHRPGTSN